MPPSACGSTHAYAYARTNAAVAVGTDVSANRSISVTGDSTASSSAHACASAGANPRVAVCSDASSNGGVDVSTDDRSDPIFDASTASDSTCARARASHSHVHPSHADPPTQAPSGPGEACPGLARAAVDTDVSFAENFDVSTEASIVASVRGACVVGGHPGVV